MSKALLLVFVLGGTAVILDLSRLNEKNGALEHVFVRGRLPCNLSFAQSKAESTGAWGNTPAAPSVTIYVRLLLTTMMSKPIKSSEFFVNARPRVG